MTSATAPALTPEALRERFPALAGPTVRLDGPGASQVPRQVSDAVAGYLTGSNANLGGAFAASVASAGLFGTARARAAEFFGAADAAEVGFGLNASTVNAALADAAAAALRPGDEVVFTALDHESNIEPWHRAAAKYGLVVRTAGIDAGGRLDSAALEAALGERTRIVAFPYANNATGTRVDVEAVAGIAHRAGAVAWADATHYAPHGPMNVAESGVDVAFCSAYKFFGPHVGLFYARRELLAAWSGGGSSQCFEHGTPPLESLAGLVAAFDYLEEVGWDFITAHERALGERFLSGLPAPWRLHGRPSMDGRTATFAVTLPGAEPADLARAFADRGVAIGSGDFHAPATTTALGLREGVARIGFLHYNTFADVDAALAAMSEAAGS